VENRIILTGKLIDALESDAGWVEIYGITGELIVPDTHEADVGIQELLLKAKKVAKLHYQFMLDNIIIAVSRSQTPTSSSRKLEGNSDSNGCPFDECEFTPCFRLLASCDNSKIVAAVAIQVLSTPFATTSNNLPSLHAGQPISAHLIIHTSFHWGESSNEASQYLLRFNIEEVIREWLISGPKRGDFVAVVRIQAISETMAHLIQDGGTYTVPITLIALHHGEFFLPKVSVTALPIAGATAMGSLAVPSIETYQVHGAEKVRILPRGGRSTFVVGMGPTSD